MGEDHSSEARELLAVVAAIVADDNTLLTAVRILLLDVSRQSLSGLDDGEIVHLVVARSHLCTETSSAKMEAKLCEKIGRERA